MPGRNYNAANRADYRYGFNGKENDSDVKGVEGGQQDYGMRIYDPRVGKFLSVDPLTKSYPHYTPYSYAGNKPTKFIDLDGGEEAKNWADYDFNDLMNWFSKPSVPKDNGFLHSSFTGFNRTINPFYYGWVAVTGIDPASADYPKMTRMDAVTVGVPMVILHKSFTIAAKPNAATVLEQQVIKNKVAIESAQKELAVEANKQNLIKITEEDGVAVIRDVNNKSVGRGWLAYGELNLSIKTKGTEFSGRGNDIFRSLFEYVNNNFDKISAIRGTWRQSMPSNLNKFNQLLSEGKSLSEAALGTFTGDNAKILGFTNAEVLSSSVKDSKGVYTSVDVLFKK